MAVLVATTVAANAADGIRREAVRTWGDIASSARPAHPADARVIVVLRAKPAATRHDAVGSDAAATAAKTAQDRALAQIASAGVELAVQQRFTRTVNAVVATVRGDQRARLAADRRVLGVFAVRQLAPASVSESVATALGDAVRPVASGLPGDGAGVTIAVLDGPLDENHAALAGRVDHAAGGSPGSSDATAEHGTAIASLAAGADGPAGLHGVAPGARVLAIRVLTPSGDGTLTGTTADLLAGLEQAADPNGDGDLADHARVAVAAAAAAGGAAVGLGTLVTLAASTVAADVTGILLASVVLGLGFLIIPARRRRAKATLDEKVAALRARLTAALQAEFARARERSGHRLRDAVAPYARFVNAEERRWSDAQQSLIRLHDATASFLTELTASGA